ncbi:hypothetical protein EJB05_50910, partial [Eragrostis curvula]
MSSPTSSGAAARKHLRVLLPFSRKSLRIPDELAEDIGAAEAHVVIPFGKGKVRRVEVGRDGDGAFLGRGWPEFENACGVGAGWLLVLRHHGAGVLTVKGFDDTCCLRMQAREPPAASMSKNPPSHRPQFINVLQRGFTEKMVVPAKFVQHYIPKEHLDSQMAIISVPLGRKSQIELERNQSGVFFAAGWSQFLAFHGITEANCLLLRYEGDMMFTVKVFEPEGCQRDFTHDCIKMQQIIEKKHVSPSVSVLKSKNEWPSSEGQKKQKVSKCSLKKTSLRKRSFYEIGPPSWIKKVINARTLENHLSLARAFCDAIGLLKPCTITLKTSIDSTRYWQKGEKDKSSSEERKGTKGFMTPVKKASSARKCIFDIGPPAWIKKTINTCTIKNVFSLPLAFCVGIGLREPCRITLKTSMSSSMSWQARVAPYKYCSQMCGSGWKRFCQDNGLKEDTETQLGSWLTYLHTASPAMASSGDSAATTARKHLRVLLPFSRNNLRIPDELAGEISGGEALLVVQSSGRQVWPVKVGQDGDGAFLGRGWRAFADACGVGGGWLLVLRHRGRGVLTVKVFDDSGCLMELGTPIPPAVQTDRLALIICSAEGTTGIKETADEATASSKARFKPQFIRVLPQDFMEKMLLPAKFVQHYIVKEHLNDGTAVIFVPLGKKFQIELKMNQSGMFFAGGWSQFLSLHNITRPNTLLLRYEGNMVFTVKVFEPNGCLRDKDIRMQPSEQKINDFRIYLNLLVMDLVVNYMSLLSYQIAKLAESEQLQETPPLSIQNHKSKTDWPSNEGEGQKKQKGSMTILKKRSKIYCVYDIGPPAWMKKKVDFTMVEKHHFTLPRPFCNAIGFQEPCMITLQASMDSTKLWQVQGHTYNSGSCQIGSGWNIFCRDTRLREGDVLTINVIQTTLWLVVITRGKENLNHSYHAHETPSSSRGEKRPNGSLTNLEHAKTRCIFEIGPPAWVKKEINTSTIEDHLSLPAVFCDAIGLQETCLITLQSSLCGARSWQVCVSPNKNRSHRVTSGWKRFYQENELKVGDACTFNIVETRLWEVDIERC